MSKIYNAIIFRISKIKNMSSSEKSRNKDIMSFHRLCKDLYKFIQKRIIKKYVNPQIQYEPNDSLGPIISKNKEWKYYNTKEKVTEEEKILDIFKNNAFLAQLKNYYEVLENLVKTMDENEKNVELLQKDIELGEKKLEMLSRLNTQLNEFFNVKGGNNDMKNNNDANKNNTYDRIHLVKSLNILNELKIFNNNNEESDKCIKNTSTTSNTTITNNNNIILDNKIINNNIRDSKLEPIKEQESLSLKEEAKEIEKPVINQITGSKKKRKNKNKAQSYNEAPNCDIKLLNKKSKRDESSFQEKTETFIQAPDQKSSLINPNFLNNANNNTNNNIINNDNKNSNNNNNDLSTQSNNHSIDNKEEKTAPPPLSIPEQVDNANIKEEEKIDNPNPEICEGQTNLEYEFEKVLKEKFSFVCNVPDNKIPKQKKVIISEINQIKKKIRNLKFNKKDKFDDPYLIGSYQHFDVINLMDYVPPIDIMFKCKNIRSVAELKEIVSDTMKKRMQFNYLELSNEYDKKNEIVKFYHRCKITKGPKDNANNFFILFNIFFVGVNLSNFSQKEECINRFYFNNCGMYDCSGKILISLYFRRWRKKYNLRFMMPEFLDIIINYYYNTKNNLSFIIEEIFLDLFNGNFRFLENKEGENENNNASEDVENMKEIKKYILEWYNNEEFKKKMCDAILDTQELIMNSKFYNTFNSDKAD